MVDISIIVPIYNVERYLPKCIDSLMSQTINNIEIILVNDGSPDGCLQICRHFEEIDSRVIVITQENGGVSSARNAGLKIATGNFIMFVDPDDWIEKDACEVLLGCASKYDVDFVLSNARIINGSRSLVFRRTETGLVNMDKMLNLLKQYNPLVFLHSIHHSSCAKLFSRKIQQEYCIYFPIELKYGEDASFCLEYSIHSKRAFFCDTVTYNNLVRPGSAGRSERKEYFNTAMNAVNNFYAVLIKNGYPELKKETAYYSYAVANYTLDVLINTYRPEGFSQRIKMVKNILKDKQIQKWIANTDIRDFHTNQKIQYYCCRYRLILFYYALYKTYRFIKILRKGERY